MAEDEPLVRSFFVRTLSRSGYRVLAAADGVEALHLFTAHQTAIALAVLDVIMPGLNGYEVYQRLRELSPQIKVLFCTGYAAAGPQPEFPPDDQRRMLRKPFDTATMLRAVREVLDGAAQLTACESS